MRIKDISDSDKPRERILFLGPQALSNAELLALILRIGSEKENIITQSQRILSNYPLEKLKTASIQELLTVKGLGIAKASQIVAFFELSRRTNNNFSKKKIITREDAINYIRQIIGGFEQEHVLVIWLNTQNMILGHEVITKGLVNECLVHVREAFRGAIKANASRIIVAHNHPTNDKTPSKEDEKTTQTLKQAGKIIGIPVLDHIIV